MQNLVWRRIYPFLLTVVVFSGFATFQAHQFKRLYEHIKNDKWALYFNDFYSQESAVHSSDCFHSLTSFVFDTLHSHTWMITGVLSSQAVQMALTMKSWMLLIIKYPLVIWCKHGEWVIWDIKRTHLGGNLGTLDFGYWSLFQCWELISPNYS